MAGANTHGHVAPGHRAHLASIDGVSIPPLAKVFHKAGMVIISPDMRNSTIVEHPCTLGIPMAIGHWGENVQGVKLVIRTAAVHDENLEIAAIRVTSIPVSEWVWARDTIMKGYKNALCIAGICGKIITTSMCVHIIMAARMDPTVMIGGTLPLLGFGYRVGHGDTIILRSCECCNSFLSFFLIMMVVFNTEADHLGFFKDLDDVEHSLHASTDRVPESGVIVANADGANTMHTLEGEGWPVLAFGLEQGDVHAANLTWNRGLPPFDVVYRGDVFTHVTLRAPGEHNIKNASAAVAAATALAVGPEVISEGLVAFRGVGRRFEHKGTCHGAEVYDDYAHRPGGPHIPLSTTRTLGYEQVIYASQSHAYTRTHVLLSDPVEVFYAPDITLLVRIYVACEIGDIGISSKGLVAHILSDEYYATLSGVAEQLRILAWSSDLILTVGAGNISTVSGALLRGG